MLIVTKELADLVRADWVRLGRNRRSLGLIADLHGTSKETIALILNLDLPEEDKRRERKGLPAVKPPRKRGKVIDYDRMDANNKALQYCIKGVLYRVYDVENDKGGDAWYQITPGDACITNGAAPVCWVSGECGTFTAKQPASPADSLKEAALGLRVIKFTPASEDAAEALARAMLALRLPVYAAVSDGDAANLKLVADSHETEYEEV